MAVAMIVVFASLCQKVDAQVYSWTDEHGRLRFADDFSKVPEEYKKSAVPIGPKPSAPMTKERAKQTERGRAQDQKKFDEVRGSRQSSSLKKKAILGSTRSEVIEMFKTWRRNYKFEKVRANGVKFENEDLMVVVLFNVDGMADGVSFLSMDVSDLTGKTSYVYRNYTELINWATGGKKVRIENNAGSTYPCEVYIGNMYD